MKLTKFDIGAEIISILTRGMYPDPRDAVREYIQNAIDANAKNLDIKVRQNSVVVEDDGIGMDYKTLRNAIRVGVSDKRPGKDVGFMGIGIYSAFHLCDTLTIYTRQKSKFPQILEMNFKGMRLLLKEQKEKRINKEITSEDLTDLQTLLETFITLPDENKVAENEYPVENGTRVELVGLNPVLDDYLKDFEELGKYLQDVVPLHFDKDGFKWAEIIEEKITEICEQHDARFELISLKLQVGSQSRNLFRPYKDSEFNYDSPRMPKFIPMEDKDEFYGVAWGCLNSYDESSGRKQIRISNKDLRGFLLMKQGFAIGKREYLAKYFGKSKTHFDRYTGEIIITNPKILPNAARNDLEVSTLRTKLILIIQEEIAPQFVAISDKYQEDEKAKEVLRVEGNALKRVLAKYNPNEDNYRVFLNQISDIDSVIKRIESKVKRLSGEDGKEADNILRSANKLKREILLKFDQLTTTKKRRKSRTPKKDSTTEVAQNLSNYTAQELTIRFDSLLDLVDSLDLDYNEGIKKLFDLIDESVVQALATSKNNYYQILNQLKDDFEND